MPELPDITVYVERLRVLAVGQELRSVRITNPFVLRTVDPAPESLVGRTLENVGRIGKRIVLGLEGERYAVIHLMLLGRLGWRPQGATLPKKTGMMAFDFATGSLVLTEASSRHRVSVHLVLGRDELEQFERGGVDVFRATADVLAAALRRQNRTLKRALTDPAITDGIGNAYSDEILHRARLSPFAPTVNLSDGEVAGFHVAAVDVLTEWTARLRDEAGDGFPRKVTAFHPEMAVHGKYGRPCPVCDAPVQRIIYAESEANYCPGCQTGGRILADRSLSRLLKNDWPRTLEELERGRPRG